MSDNSFHPTTTNPLPDEEKNRNNPLSPAGANPKFTDEEMEGDAPSSANPLPDTGPYRRLPGEQKSGVDAGNTDDDQDPDSRDPLPDTDPYNRRPSTEPEFTDEELSDMDEDIDPNNPLPDESLNIPGQQSNTPL
jgi:hypothetical protein